MGDKDNMGTSPEVLDTTELSPEVLDTSGLSSEVFDTTDLSPEVLDTTGLSSGHGHPGRGCGCFGEPRRHFGRTFGLWVKSSHNNASKRLIFSPLATAWPTHFLGDCTAY